MLRNVWKYIHENNTSVGGLRKRSKHERSEETICYVMHRWQIFENQHYESFDDHFRVTPVLANVCACAYTVY